MRIPCVQVTMLFLALLGLGGCRALTAPRALREQNALLDRKALGQDPARPLPSPLSLAGAIGYGLANNLEIRVARQEREIQEELASQSRLRMLPALLMNAEASRRSEHPANSSVNLLSGQESAEVSYSAEKDSRRLNLTALWNLLDFGVACLRSSQARDHCGIAELRLQRSRQTLVLDITRAYWRAVAARALSGLAREVDSAIGKMLVAIGAAREQGALSEVEYLQREVPLLEQRAKLTRVQDQYEAALSELAALIGAAPGARPQLAEVDLESPVPAEEIDLESFEAEALLSRPELGEKDLEERISRLEARAALAQMFPSPAAFLRYDADSNRLLYSQDWYSAGLRASWNLLDLPQRAREQSTAMARAELARQRRLALAVGILSQVHLALLDYESQARQLANMETISRKREGLLAALRQAVEQGKAHEGDLMDPLVKLFTARTLHWMTLANCQTAWARVLHSVGRPIAAAEPGAGLAAAPRPPSSSEFVQAAAKAPGPGPAGSLSGMFRLPDEDGFMALLAGSDAPGGDDPGPAASAALAGCASALARWSGPVADAFLAGCAQRLELVRSRRDDLEARIARLLRKAGVWLSCSAGRAAEGLFATSRAWLAALDPAAMREQLEDLKQGGRDWAPAGSPDRAGREISTADPGSFRLLPRETVFGLKSAASESLQPRQPDAGAVGATTTWPFAGPPDGKLARAGARPATPGPESLSACKAADGSQEPAMNRLFCITPAGSPPGGLFLTKEPLRLKSAVQIEDAPATAAGPVAAGADRPRAGRAEENDDGLCRRRRNAAADGRQRADPAPQPRRDQVFSRAGLLSCRQPPVADGPVATDEGLVRTALPPALRATQIRDGKPDPRQVAAHLAPLGARSE